MPGSEAELLADQPGRPRRRRPRPWVSRMTTPTSAPIALPSPASTFSAASGCCSIARSTIASSSPASLAPRSSRRSTIAAGSPPSADEHRQDLAGPPAVDLLRGDEAGERGDGLRASPLVPVASTSCLAGRRDEVARHPVGERPRLDAVAGRRRAALEERRELGVEGEQAARPRR